MWRWGGGWQWGSGPVEGGEGRGGATEGLINHSCIAIDFLLKAVSQTLNYVFVCECVL